MTGIRVSENRTLSPFQPCRGHTTLLEQVLLAIRRFDAIAISPMCDPHSLFHAAGVLNSLSDDHLRAYLDAHAPRWLVRNFLTMWDREKFMAEARAAHLYESTRYTGHGHVMRRALERIVLVG